MWRTLSHDGVRFQEPYMATRIPVKCGARSVLLSNEAEEYATAFARRPHSANFTRNFMADWAPLAPAECRSAIRTGGRVDLSALNVRPDRSLVQRPCDPAIVDGVPHPTSACRAEPAGVFLGRGGEEHPLSGRIKRRLRPSDVTLNMSRPASAAVAGRGWAAIRHDPTASWLASWSDPLTGRVKYMRLAASAGTAEQGRTERAKFEAAGRLAASVGKVRARNGRELVRPGGSPHMAVVFALVDTFALRIGRDEGLPAARRTAPTFGATTLLVRHLVEVDPLTARVRLAFPAKDSVRCVVNGELLGSGGRRVAALLHERMKQAGDATGGERRLLTKVDATAFNDYLTGTLLKGILSDHMSAKTIRTFRVCATFEATIRDSAAANTVSRGRLVLRVANARVSLLCNHRSSSVQVADATLLDAPRAMQRILVLLGKATSDDAVIRTALQRLVRSCALVMSTSMTNYVDPRIVFRYCGQLIDKGVCDDDVGLIASSVLSATLQRRFAWAVLECGQKTARGTCVYAIGT